MIKLIGIRAPTLGEYQVVLEGTVVHFVFEPGSEAQLIFEARYKGTPLVGQYSAALHKAHIPDGQGHLHIFAKKNQLFALNQDGTAHDQSHGVRIPNRVADAIRADYPEFTLPAGNIIESAPPFVAEAYRLLLE